MHILISHASPPGEAGRHALGLLELPHLRALLGHLQAQPADGGDEWSLSPPHERVLARSWGWTGADGALPFAAAEVQACGRDPGDLAWGRLTPLHWQLGRDHLTALPPDVLALDETESRALFDAAAPLFESEGWLLLWNAPDRWFAAHESLADLPTAALDRIVGRNPDAWLPDHPQARTLRRLQNEVQMLWYAHPVNDAREASNRPTVNTVWLSGCGVYQPPQPVRADLPPPTWHADLRAAQWNQDGPAWLAAWQRLDETVLRDAWQQASRGAALTLTLTGERQVQSHLNLRRNWMDRLRARWAKPIDLASRLATL